MQAKTAPLGHKNTMQQLPRRTHALKTIGFVKASTYRVCAFITPLLVLRVATIIAIIKIESAEVLDRTILGQLPVREFWS